MNNKNKPFVLDGALGALLQNQIDEAHSELWSSYANISAPDKVIDLHCKYIEAGADIITTNTFRTNPFAIYRSVSKLQSFRMVVKAVQLAKTAIDGKKILIAGCNPPAEDCYQCERKISFLELKKNHKSHINSLKKNGVDFILNETQSHFDEIKIICDECFGFPFVVSLFLTEDLKLLSGEKASNVIEYLLAYMPVGKLIAVGVNCINQKTFKRFLKEIQPDFPWGFYLNCGTNDYTDKNITCSISPSKYLKIIEPALEYNPLFIGSCCGSTPNHTAAIRKYVDELYRN